MGKFRSLLALVVMLPLVAVGSSLGSSELAANALPTESDRAGLDQTAGYDCCWIYFMGKWWCVPC